MKSLCMLVLRIEGSVQKVRKMYGGIPAVGRFVAELIIILMRSMTQGVRGLNKAALSIALVGLKKLNFRLTL